MESVLIAPNGLQFSPEIKFEQIDKYDAFNHRPENTKKVVLSWE